VHWRTDAAPTIASWVAPTHWLVSEKAHIDRVAIELLNTLAGSSKTLST
jgi:hypothetical protein